MLPVSVIGGIIMDIKGLPREGALLHHSNRGKITYTPGGVGRNIAENLVRLGVPVSMFGVVGDDPFGQRLIEDCRKLGMNTEGIVCKAGQNTAVDLGLLQPDGDLWLSLTEMQITEDLRVGEVARFAERLFTSSMIVADANLSVEVLQYVLTGANQRGIPFLIDPVTIHFCDKLNDLKGDIYVATPNQAEATKLTKNVDKLLISCGKDGCNLQSTHYQQDFPALTVDKLVDTTGAGDAFLAGLVAALYHNVDWPDCIQWGQACAALTLQSMHNVRPDLNLGMLQAMI
ncbi:MAG: carbohydrate kinase family protein [Bacteroidota bacterium]